jgi:chitin disaccharide deacetylase
LVPDPLRYSHEKVTRFLNRSRYALLLYNPFLRNELRLLVNAQLEEFARLYHRSPTHIDGHRHLHLCTNVLIDHIIPRGRKVRRSFSFCPGEKSGLNRAYRAVVSWWLRRHYITSDHFFCLRQCIEKNRLARVATVAREAPVELMTHPHNPVESNYLLSDDYSNQFRNVPMGSYLDL